MTLEINFWFNYSCPFSFLTRRLLREAALEAGARIRSHPFERQAEIQESALPQRIWEHTVLPLAERLGVPVGETPPAPAADTRSALLGYRYACDRGRGEVYSDQVFSAHFQERADIGDLATLERLAERAGLDPGEFHAAVTAREYAERHRLALEGAKTLVALTPTITGGHLRIEGVPTTEQLRRLLGGSGSGRLSLTGTGALPERAAASGRPAGGRRDGMVVEAVECGLHQVREALGDPLGQTAEQPCACGRRRLRHQPGHPGPFLRQMNPGASPVTQIRLPVDVPGRRETVHDVAGAPRRQSAADGEPGRTEALPRSRVQSQQYVRVDPGQAGVGGGVVGGGVQQLGQADDVPRQPIRHVGAF
jgi:predicted DsbA family dithiol-disulfide isomerase